MSKVETQTPKGISSYKDLEVYRDTYNAAITVNRHILSKLPPTEKFDLIDQLRRSSKAIPRLIAEGYAKRHQKLGFQKYLDDAMAECNETCVSLEQCKDIYDVDCGNLVELYEIAGKRIYRLAEAWTNMKARYTKHSTPPSGIKPASLP